MKLCLSVYVLLVKLSPHRLAVSSSPCSYKCHWFTFAFNKLTNPDFVYFPFLIFFYLKALFSLYGFKIKLIGSANLLCVV